MIVWVDMLPKDNSADLGALVDEMNNPHFWWFQDPNRRAGRTVAASLGAEGSIAWDIYLFYSGDAEWKDGLPQPRGWVHQLDDPWADPARHKHGDQLEPELAKLLQEVATG